MGGWNKDGLTIQWLALGYQTEIEHCVICSSSQRRTCHCTSSWWYCSIWTNHFKILNKGRGQLFQVIRQNNQKTIFLRRGVICAMFFDRAYVLILNYLRHKNSVEGTGTEWTQNSRRYAEEQKSYHNHSKRLNNVRIYRCIQVLKTIRSAVHPHWMNSQAARYKSPTAKMGCVYAR